MAADRFVYGRGAIALLMVIALGLVCGCGGGGDGDGAPAASSLAALSGQWFGVLRRADESHTRVDLTLDGSGLITSYLLAGVDQGITGALTRLESQTYAFEVTDGSIVARGTIVTDAAGLHMGFVSSNGEFAILEHATPYSVPEYTAGELTVGTFSGRAARVDGAAGFLFSSSGDWQSTSDIDNNGSGVGHTFTAGMGCGFSACACEWGHYFGCTELDGVGFASLYLYLSPDREFVAGYVLDSGDSFPADAIFLFLRRL